MNWSGILLFYYACNIYYHSLLLYNLLFSYKALGDGGDAPEFDMDELAALDAEERENGVINLVKQYVMYLFYLLFYSI